MRRPYIDPSDVTRLRMLGLTGSGSGVRASDAERERAAETLRRHHADGRLTTDELEERTAQAYAATTRGDLDRLFADLPRLRTPEEEQPQRRSLPLPAFAFPILVALLAIAVVTSAHFLWLAWPLMIFLFFRFAIGRRAGWRSRGWPDPWRRY